MPKTNIPAGGGMAAPPDDAPMQRTQPLRSDAGAIVVHDPVTKQPTGEIITPEARARQNERQLAPLTYGREVPSQVRPIGVQSPSEVEAPKDVQAAPQILRPSDPTRPAESNTDTPTRGIPGTAHSPFRTQEALPVEGGFGGTFGEYFALDGPEMLAAAQHLLQEVHDQIVNDIRFSIAAAYPRYSVTVQLIVEAEAQECVRVEKVAAKEAVPLEIAQQHADSVVFVVRSQRREFNAADDIETPPDALRAELGIVGPKKVITQGPFGTMASDIRLGL